MPRRGENIYKRKDGRWEGRILLEDGKYKYVYAKSYKEVKEKKKNYQKHTKRNISKVQVSAERLFESWLINDVYGQVKPSTYENYYRCMYQYVIPFFQNTNNERLTAFSVARFVNSIKNNICLSESYKRKILSIFKTAVRSVLKGTEDYSSIIETIKIPAIKDSNIHVFSIKEQQLIENVILCSNDLRTIGILVCFYSGIRLGELCALKWSDINFDAGTMAIMRTVSRTKNFEPGQNKTTLLVGIPKSQNSVRKIPLPNFILSLSTESKIFDNEKYILSGTEVPIDPRIYQRLYKRVLKKAGVKYRKFHAIRHTFATRALELGVDIKTLSEILGHSNVSITLNVYAHSLMEHKKMAIDKFNTMHFTQISTDSSAVNNSVITA